MEFTIMILVLYAILHIPFLGRLKGLETKIDKASVAMGIAFLIPGVMHFTNPSPFALIIPRQIPWHLGLVYISGVFEILGGLGLMLRVSRKFSGIGLAIMLLAVFPANINAAVSHIKIPGLPEGDWYYWSRLPWQLLYIAWALWCAGVLKKTSKNVE